MTLYVGTYVKHAKLPDLGSGEIISSDGQNLVIRFASGEKNFIAALAEKHLIVTAEAPAPAKAARGGAKSSRAPRAKKAAAKAAPQAKPDEP